MIRLVVNDVALDLSPNAQIRIKRRSPAYLGEDVGKIKGDYSFPFTLQMTGRNRRTLRYPDRLDNAELLSLEFRAQIYVGSDLVITGGMRLRRATRTEAEAFVFSNPLGDLTKVKLSETDQGEIGGTNAAELNQLMRLTTQLPLSFPAIFAPVYNLALRDDTSPSPSPHHFFNSYDLDRQEFRTEHHVSPLVRVEPMLRRAIEGAGYTFRNGLHDTDEMKRQVLITNRSMKVEEEDGDVYSYRIPLAMCLPDITVSDFLKSLCRTYCLAPFSDLAGTHLDLTRLDPLIARSPRADWTDFAGREYERQGDSAAVARYDWGEAAHADTYFQVHWAAELEEVDYDPGPGRTSKRVARKTFGVVLNPEGTETVTPQILPAQTNLIYNMPDRGVTSLLPSVAFEPVGVFTDDPSTEYPAGQVISQEGTIEARLSFYRGMHMATNRQQYPLVNHQAVASRRSPTTPGDVENLNWPDLYDRHWKDWDVMLQRTTPVKRSFILPIAQLLQFDFRDKVRVENRSHFVRDLEFTVTQRGVSPTDCTLIAVS